MNDKIQVNSSTFLALFKSKGPYFVVGTVFTFIAIFVLIPLVAIISLMNKKPYEAYDFKAIEKDGIEKYAKITEIKSLIHIKVYGEHPQMISYVYENNGQMNSDKFQTMDLDKVAELKVGNEIKIKVYNNQSIIENLEPYSFPFHYFYILPVIFLIIGVTLLVIGKYKL